jgi:cyclohexa-1,5-dienecarbonyl-CoA hydratase
MVKGSLENGIGRITLADPPLNILDRKALAGIREQLAALAAESALRVVVLDAEGPHFSAGASVDEHLPPEYEAMIPEFGETIRAIHAFPLPVLAAVRGRCLGGGLEVALAADIVVAGESAVLGLPEIRLGVFPPAACALLPALTHAAVAAELVFTGAPLDASAAAAAGLVRHVVPDDLLEERVLALAGQIGGRSAAALRLAKRALREAADSGPGAGLDRATRIYLDDLMATEDAVEGLTAFVEKRPPAWSHR